MTQLTTENLQEFLNARPLAVIHIDADWDAKHRETARKMMEQAIKELGDRASFGEVDSDAEHDYCRSIEVTNIPCIAYYRNGKFVTQIVGASQDIAAVLQAMQTDPPTLPHILRRVAHHSKTHGYGKHRMDPDTPSSLPEVDLSRPHSCPNSDR